MARRILVITLIFALVLTLMIPLPAPAHDGYPPIPIFVFRTHPDLPFEEYVNGKLGIVLPSYDDLFLFIAYRNLSGASFTPAEIKVLQSLWNPLINVRMKAMAPSSQKDWMHEWFRRRSAMKHQATPEPEFPYAVNPWNQKTIGGEILFFLNCPEDAFHTALRTLDERERTFGTANREVTDWAEAQDQVFLNCGKWKDTQPRAIIPKTAAPSDSPVLRADRSYQIAAAHFYSGDYDQAIHEFDAIAQDGASPWNKIAPYLAARAALRKGTLSGGEFKFDKAAFAEAESRLNAVLRDPTRRQWHAASLRLLAFVRIRLHSRERLAELALELSKTGGLAGNRQDLVDFFYLLERGPREAFQSPDDMTLWILSFREAAGPLHIDAQAQWQRTKSLPWLVAALQAESNTKGDPSRLLAEADLVPKSSVAFRTVSFLRARVSLDMGKTAEARQILDGALRDPELRTESSTTNLFLALRMHLSENLREFLNFLPRRPAGIVYTDEYEFNLDRYDKYRKDGFLRGLYSHPMFDNDSGVILNGYFPLSLLAQTASENSLAADLRKQVALMAFVRAVVLHRSSVAAQLAGTLVQLAPEMKEELAAYQTADSDSSREFAAVFLILRYPGLATAIESGSPRDAPVDKLEPYSDNWWCFTFERTFLGKSGEESQEWSRDMTRHLQPVYRSGHVEPPVFLSEHQIADAREELKQLLSAESGPDWLDARAIAWAKAHPEDPRTPEVLHLAVRAYRYGCSDLRSVTKFPTGRANFSKQAFDLLHHRYPGSEWTKKTPYWF